jgi:hypothetical protein
MTTVALATLLSMASFAEDDPVSPLVPDLEVEN